MSENLRQYVPPNPLRPSDILPTRAVRFKATGAEATINARDFDPEQHEDQSATRAELSALTVTQLVELAAANSVTLWAGAKKAEILAALAAAGVTG